VRASHAPDDASAPRARRAKLAPLSVRDTHRAYVASLSPGELAGAADGVIDQPTAKDDASLYGEYTSLRIEYPTPDDLVEIIWEAEDSTVPTIGDDG
jgi:hypothetical protein